LPLNVVIVKTLRRGPVDQLDPSEAAQQESRSDSPASRAERGRHRLAVKIACFASKRPRVRISPLDFGNSHICQLWSKSKALAEKRQRAANIPPGPSKRVRRARVNGCKARGLPQQAESAVSLNHRAAREIKSAVRRAFQLPERIAEIFAYEPYDVLCVALFADFRDAVAAKSDI